MKIAVILPLFDREGTGWKSLELALNQTMERERYQVVAIVGGRSEEDVHNDPRGRSLLAQCDAVVRYGEDLDGIENRMLIYRAGADAVSADTLYLVEGHTVLRSDACVAIARHFAANPESRILYAPRFNISSTRCSEVQDHLNTYNQSRSVRCKVFSLGGENALTRELFDGLSAAARDAGPFAETMVQHELHARAVPVVTLDRPLCDHFNAWTSARTVEAGMMLGNAYFERFDAPSAPMIGLVGRKRVIYGFARHAGIALALWPVARVAGALCVRLGVPLFRVHKDMGRAVTAFGVKAAILAGFCRARIRFGNTPSPSLAAQQLRA